MTFHLLLPFSGALLCSALAAAVLVRDRRSLVYQIFAIGMIALALEGIFSGLSTQDFLLAEALRWQRLRWTATASLPVVWLLFSLCFARTNYKELISKWKWVILAVLVIPLTLATFFWGHFYAVSPVPDEPFWGLHPLGWSGYLFHFFFMLSSVLILTNLERTLRASIGDLRWQIKFILLGIGGLFAVRIYTSSQALLFSSMDPALDEVNSAALLVAGLLTFASLIRTQLLPAGIYLSPAFLYNSIIIVVVGLYLVAVGGMAKAVGFWLGSEALPLAAFLVFLALVGLTIVLLSDQLRLNVKRLFSRHLRIPHYDYRREWMNLTQRTTSLLDIQRLCAAIANSAAETFGVSAVNLWLLDEAENGATLGGSTALSEAQARNSKSLQKGALELTYAMRGQQFPVDFDRPGIEWTAAMKEANPDYFRIAQIRYAAALFAGPEFVGLMTLNERVTKEPFLVEDFDLLKTIADQSAATLLNIKISQRLLRAKEMDAFQTLSAFFVHDLKNLASSLSLTLQNSLAYFDDPAFRHDALRTISQSVDRINSLCGRLSSVGRKLDLKPTETDLNELVATTVANLNGSVTGSLVLRLCPLARLVVDSDQIQKVLVNLILNAAEAIEDGGEIEIATEQHDGWAILSVRDNGCGMSKGFIAHSLFRPFQTTKEQGSGIGLFQSKKIVEAHRGRIEVESEEGKGSTFQVLLPVESR